MNKKLIGTVFAVFALVSGLVAFESYGRDYGKDKKKSFNLEEKFSYKSHLILGKKQELDISDEVVDKIKALKLNIKKALIRKNAEIQILALDIKSEFTKDTKNVDKINKLIDRKYSLKKEKTKSLVSAYSDLKDMLTKEQKDKLKEISKKCKKSMMHGSMMKEKAPKLRSSK